MTEQIREMTPDSDRDKIIIHENHDPLVEIAESPHIKLNLLKPTKEARFIRKTFAEKLILVSESLPQDLVLMPIEGYRSMESQQEGWDNWCNAIRDEHPDWSKDQVEEAVVRIVARPNPLANHHCGGAIDITIGYSNGLLIDMGTSYPSGGEDDAEREKFNMLSKNISHTQAANRKILRDAMAVHDIAYYPAEWWHYCWGDRMWAVHTRQSTCVYGAVDSIHRRMSL